MIERAEEERSPVLATAIKFLSSLEADADFDKEKIALIDALTQSKDKVSAKTLALFLNFIKIYSHSLPQRRQSGFFKSVSYAFPDNLTSFEKNYLSGFEKVSGYQNLQTLLAIYGWVRGLSWQFNFEQGEESSLSDSIKSIEKWSKILSQPVQKSEGNLLDLERNMTLDGSSYTKKDFAQENIYDYLTAKQIKNYQDQKIQEEEIAGIAYKAFMEQGIQLFLAKASAYNQVQKNQLVNLFSQSGQHLMRVVDSLIEELSDKGLLNFDNILTVDKNQTRMNYFIDDKGQVCFEFFLSILTVRNTEADSVIVAETDGQNKNLVKIDQTTYLENYPRDHFKEPLFDVTACIVLSPHEENVKPVLQNLHIQSNLAQLSPFAWSGDPLEFVQKQKPAAHLELKK